MDRDAFSALIDRHRAAAPTGQARPGTAAAMALVTEGTVVSASEGPAEPRLPGTGLAVAGVPQPFALAHWWEEGEVWAAANHRIEMDIHGVASMTHIDAIDHFRWDGTSLPGGRLSDLSRGLVTRGVLVDVPGVLDVDVPPGHVLTLEDVQETLRRERVELQRGDALYLRLGRTGTRCAHSDLSADPMVGLSFECHEWLADAAPAVVLTDAGLDPNPSEVTGIPVPWHLLLLTGLGIPLVDMAALDDLSATCARLGRYAFASVIAPLPIPEVSGSPVNPLALF